MTDFAHDRTILRQLATVYAEIAALPIQQEKIGLWKALNALKAERPMIVIDQMPWNEMDVDGELTLRCRDEFCRSLETHLRRTIYRWRHMPGDLAVPPFINVPMAIRNTGFGVSVQEQRLATDAGNNIVSHHYFDQLAGDADLDKVRGPVVTLDAEATQRRRQQALDIFDGILEVRMQGQFPAFALWDQVVALRGGEAVIYDLIDRPDFMHRIAARFTRAHLAMLDQLESQGLLGRDQQEIHCCGAWSDELPAPGYDSSRPRAKDLWTFGMSQIFSTVSPAMHEEFELPYLSPWFERFGLVYYGCCEPLDLKMDMIRKLPNVRKISMSPWVDVERGAAQIGRDYVFSRKPSPAIVAGESFDADAVRSDIQATLDACKRHGCACEIVLKDISTVRHQPQRLWEYSKIAMSMVQ